MTPARDPGGRCLVLGYDRGESSARAARWAAGELARDGKLVIVHACRSLHAVPSPLSTSSERERIGRAVVDELLLEDDDSLFDVDFATEVSDENPVIALTKAARHHRAHAIVVGHEQHSRPRRALGTVTSELVKSSPVPVIIVPNTGLTAGHIPISRSGDAP